MNIYKVDIEYNNSHEMFRHFLTVYSTVSNIKHGGTYIRPQLVKVLTFYLLKGYNETTKDLIINSIKGMTRKNLNQINSELQKKGYLIKDKYAHTLRHLNQPLKDIKAYIESSNQDPLMLLATFNKKK